MNNKKIMALVALLAVLIGLIGVIVCVTPGQNAPERLISNYVSAINSCNTAKMQKMGAASFMSEMMGGVYSDLSAAFGNVEAAPADSVYSALQSSAFGAVNGLPDGVTEVKAVKVVGCVVGEQESYMGLIGMNVTVVLEVSYVDAEGETQSLYSTESVGVMKYRNKYYIAG